MNKYVNAIKVIEHVDETTIEQLTEIYQNTNAFGWLDEIQGAEISQAENVLHRAVPSEWLSDTPEVLDKEHIVVAINQRNRIIMAEQLLRKDNLDELSSMCEATFSVLMSIRDGETIESVESKIGLEGVSTCYATQGLLREMIMQFSLLVGKTARAFTKQCLAENRAPSDVEMIQAAVRAASPEERSEIIHKAAVFTLAKKLLRDFEEEYQRVHDFLNSKGTLAERKTRQFESSIEKELRAQLEEEEVKPMGKLH